MKEKNHLAQKTLFSPHIGAKTSVDGEMFGRKTGVTYGLELIFMLVDRR